MTTDTTRPAGTEWTLRSWYATSEGENVALLLEPGGDRGAVCYSRDWPTAPRFVEYNENTDAINAFIDSVTDADGRGVVTAREG